MFVGRIDKVLGNYQARHLQTSHVAIKLAAHLGPVEATGSTEFTGNETDVFSKRRKDDVINSPFCWQRIFTATVVTEIGPPLATDKPCFLVIELAIDATTIRHDGPFPLPQRPVPPAIVEHHITAVVSYHLLSRETTDATIQQRQESHLVNKCCQLGSRIYLIMLHLQRQNLFRVFLGLHLLAGENLFDDALLINNKGGADSTHRLLTIHRLLTPGTHGL